eukprot:COSAG04_NODE_3911_length_2427_cov_2.432560_1_plen_211_part_10
MPARVGSPAGLPGSPKGVGVPRARAVRELDSSAVGIHDIGALDAVLTLARVAYDAHRSAPRKDTRTDAVNKLRIAEDLLVTAIENPRSREAPESATEKLLKARLRQTRKRLAHLTETAAPRAEDTAFGKATVPAGKVLDCRAGRKPALPSPPRVKRKPHRVGCTLNNPAMQDPPEPRPAEALSPSPSSRRRARARRDRSPSASPGAGSDGG